MQHTIDLVNSTYTQADKSQWDLWKQESSHKRRRSPFMTLQERNSIDEMW